MTTTKISRLLALSCLLFCFQSFAHDHHHHQMNDDAGTPSGDSLYNLHSEWRTQENKEITLSSLQGHPVVIAMAYTSCQSSCPLIVEEMRQIQSNLKSKESAVFVLASFDSKRDTPEHLKKFAQQRQLDSNHWLLLNGSPSSVQELAAALGIRYKQDATGEFDHSNLITVLDTKGTVYFQQAGLNQGRQEIERKVSDLIKATP